MSSSEIDLGRGVSIEKFKFEPQRAHRDFLLAGHEINEICGTTFALKVDAPDAKLSPTELANAVLFSLWLVTPIKTHFRYKIYEGGVSRWRCPVRC